MGSCSTPRCDCNALNKSASALNRMTCLFSRLIGSLTITDCVPDNVFRPVTLTGRDLTAEEIATINEIEDDVQFIGNASDTDFPAGNPGDIIPPDTVLVAGRGFDLDFPILEECEAISGTFSVRGNYTNNGPDTIVPAQVIIGVFDLDGNLLEGNPVFVAAVAGGSINFNALLEGLTSAVTIVIAFLVATDTPQSAGYTLNSVEVLFEIDRTNCSVKSPSVRVCNLPELPIEMCGGSLALRTVGCINETNAEAEISHLSESAPGAVAAGAWSVSFYNLTAIPALIAGTPIGLQEKIEFEGYYDEVTKQMKRLPEIAYDGTGTSLSIKIVR